VLPEDRALIGTWITEELDKAVHLAHVILEKYEAWHFPSPTQYDNQSKTGGICAGCFNLWVNTDNKPGDWCTTEDKQRYVKECLEHEGVQLEPDDIERNDGLRSLQNFY